MALLVNKPAESKVSSSTKRNRRPKKRQLFCPTHPHQLIEGNGRKYYLHLLQPGQLQQRGISVNWAQLIINAYPVLVLSHEWLEELYCPKHGSLHWCHVIRHNRANQTVRWAPRELWEQVNHVDPVVANPSASEYSRREAGRGLQKRVDGKRYYDRC